jgi:diazepam-binding inhibitor (GABA receptor modulator, acyl-CoA-binding protein)
MGIKALQKPDNDFAQKASTKEGTMSMEDQFSRAQERVNKLSRRPSDHQLLELYSLYKQAIVGNATGDRPGGFDFKGRAKWEAWKQRDGLSREEAMRQYVDLVDRLEGELG